MEPLGDNSANLPPLRSGHTARLDVPHPDTKPPLSYLATQTIHIVWPFSDDLAVEITDPENWTMTFVEEDTS